MEPAFTTKRSSAQDTDFSKCVICQSSATNGDLNCLTKRGLGAFKYAVEMRQDDVYDRLWSLMLDDNKFLSKKPVCHRICRSNYTHKKSVAQQAVKKSRLEENNPESSSVARSVDLRKRSSVDFKACCFICNKQRDSKGAWQLILVATKQRQNAIHQKANDLKDEDILVKIGGHTEESIDMIAADFRYHKSCMNNFMNRRPTQSSYSIDRVHDDAFSQLVSEITNPLLLERSGFFITQLRNRYRQILQESGVSNADLYRTDRFKKRLVDRFGNGIQIVPQRGKASLVCSSEITVSEMCSLVARLQHELNESEIQAESDESDSDINQAVRTQTDCYGLSKHLRSVMREKAKVQLNKKRTSVQASSSQTIDNVENIPELEISYDSASNSIPNDLYNHLAWIITNNDADTDSSGRVPLPAKQHHKVVNIAQELMFQTTNLPMPKQVGLAIHILKQTGSKNLVNILNRFGHTISYDSAQRYISTEAKSIDQQTIENGHFIPSGIVSSRFTQYAFDNLDFHEHTLDGSTLHATSHIIYQYVKGDEKSVASVSLKKTRRKAIEEPPTFVVPESTISLKDRREARSLQNVPLSSHQECTPSFIQDDYFMWVIMRLQYIKEENDSDLARTTAWNQFNETMCETIKSSTVIGYGPLFPQPPTNPGVVQASLDYFVSVSSKLGQKTTVVTADQAIYDIIKGITNRHPELYNDLVVRLGGFHIAENFMGTIGFFMKDGGIEELLVESGVCQRGTANKVIAGKDYYKMVRYHSIISECMIGLLWEAFEGWMRAENYSENIELYNSLHLLLNCLKIHDSQASKLLCEKIKVQLSTLTSLWNDFIEIMAVTGKYWCMYIDMVCILKKYIHAERVGDWMEHLTSVRKMIPYTVSAKHTKYMVCLPLYLKDMEELLQKHPEIHANFMKGHFTVHRMGGKFNGVWTDMALEQTYNSEGKTSLFKGISQAPASREKYVKAVPFMTKVSESVKAMAEIGQSNSGHHSDTHNQAMKDIKLVENVRKVISEKMINPFTCTNKTELINVATGRKCSSATLVEAKEMGIQALCTAERTGFKLEAPHLVTFGSETKKQSKSQSLVNIYKDESSVTRALCFAQNADDETRKKAFSHEWTAYPLSLFDTDCRLEAGYSMRKGCKSNFLTSLMLEAGIEGDISQTTLPDSPLQVVYLIDMMSFVNRCQHSSSKTFCELFKSYLQHILQMKPANCTCINIVGDRYDTDGAHSVKSYERQRRGQTKESKEFCVSSNLDIPEWKQFMANPTNKANLLHFLYSSFCECSGELPDDVTLILGGMDSEDSGHTVSISKLSTADLLNLSCGEHEEADTRLIAHIAYCVDHLKYERAVVYATDTDITMLCMYHFCRLTGLKELWIQRNNNFFPVHRLVKLLSEKYGQHPKEMTATILSTYILSGCDTVSYPYRRGKRRAAKVGLNLLGQLQHLAAYDATQHTGTLDATYNDARKYFIALYGHSDTGITCLNVLRQHIFASTKSDLRVLPPTENAFYFHVLRSLYQITLYKQASKNASATNVALPSPSDFGWNLQNGVLIPVTMSMPAKPDIKSFVHCMCKKSKCLRGCSCAKADVPCSVGCLCLGQLEKCRRTVCLSDSSEDDEP